MHNVLHSFMIKIVYIGNGQLRKKVLEAGSGPDSKPQRGQTVTINLKTTLIDGTTVEEESNISFTLGDGDVIQVYAFGVKKFWVSSCSKTCLMFCLLHPLYLFFNVILFFPGIGSHCAVNGDGWKGSDWSKCQTCIRCTGEVRLLTEAISLHIMQTCQPLHILCRNSFNVGLSCFDLLLLELVWLSITIIIIIITKTLWGAKDLHEANQTEILCTASLLIWNWILFKLPVISKTWLPSASTGRELTLSYCQKMLVTYPASLKMATGAPFQVVAHKTVHTSCKIRLIHILNSPDSLVETEKMCLFGPFSHTHYLHNIQNVLLHTSPLGFLAEHWSPITYSIIIKIILRFVNNMAPINSGDDFILLFHIEHANTQLHATCPWRSSLGCVLIMLPTKPKKKT